MIGLIEILLMIPVAWYLLECKFFLKKYYAEKREAGDRPGINSSRGQEIVIKCIFGISASPEDGELLKVLVRLRVLLACNVILLLIWFYFIFNAA